MKFRHFNTYNAEDFVLDETFCAIVSHGLPAIESLKEQFPHKQSEIDLAIEMLHKFSNMEFQQSSEKKLEQWNLILRRQKRSVRLRFIRYAAAIILIVGGGGTILLQLPHPTSIERFASSTEINKNSDATLIIANGKQIGISQKQSNIQYTSDGAMVVVNDTTEIDQTIEKESFNQMIVPFGKRANLILSDGTKVWINSGSRLVYSPVFTGKSREVFLEGEAYFEVAKNEKIPFFVSTNAFKVKVYGTKFDVQSYKDENEYNTLLIEGKVSLRKIQGGILSHERFLFPNQKAGLSENKDDFQVTEMSNINNCIAWKDGYLIFKSEAFQSILKRVSHYYNIHIELDASMQDKRLSGKLDLKDDPDRVLEGLALISKIRYSKNINSYRFY